MRKIIFLILLLTLSLISFGQEKKELISIAFKDVNLKKLGYGIVDKNMNYIDNIKDFDLKNLGYGIVDNNMDYIDHIKDFNLKKLGSGIIENNTDYIDSMV